LLSLIRVKFIEPAVITPRKHKHDLKTGSVWMSKEKNMAKIAFFLCVTGKCWY
jgi:hypothetical protein